MCVSFSLFRLTLAAYDAGTPPLSAEASVHVKVVDETVPVFQEMLYKAKVREDVEPFSPVVSVKAESPNEDKAGEMNDLNYGILFQSATIFPLTTIVRFFWQQKLSHSCFSTQA